MSPDSDTTFLHRLEVVLDGRLITPWGASLGWSKGTVSRVRKHGHVPGPETLALICHAERVCLSWLLTARGAPFRVNYCESASAAGELLREFLDEPWRVTLAVDGSGVVVVLDRPESQQLGDDGEWCEYTLVEVIVSAWDAASMAVLAHAQTPVRALPVSISDMHELRAGQMGNRRLLELLEGAVAPMDAAEVLGHSLAAAADDAWRAEARHLTPAQRDALAALASATRRAREASALADDEGGYTAEHLPAFLRHGR